MKKTLKMIFSFMLLFVSSVVFVACGTGTPTNDKNKSMIPEKVELTSAMLDEIEFANAETVKIEQDKEIVTISGKIDAMSASQKNAYAVEDVTHVVALKINFDKERTLKTFKISGNVTKVYSVNSSEEGYVGPLTDLLDNDGGEDSYCNLILSAQTKTYTCKAVYTDETERVIVIKIDATLANASAE